VTLGCQSTDSQQRGLSTDRLTAGLGMRLSVGCDRKKAAAICRRRWCGADAARLSAVNRLTHSSAGCQSTDSRPVSACACPSAVTERRRRRSAVWSRCRATLGCQSTDSQQRGLSIDRLTAGLGMRLSVGCDRKKAAAISDLPILRRRRWCGADAARLSAVNRLTHSSAGCQSTDSRPVSACACPSAVTERRRRRSAVWSRCRDSRLSID